MNGAHPADSGPQYDYSVSILHAVGQDYAVHIVPGFRENSDGYPYYRVNSCSDANYHVTGFRAFDPGDLELLAENSHAAAFADSGLQNAGSRDVVCRIAFVHSVAFLVGSFPANCQNVDFFLRLQSPERSGLLQVNLKQWFSSSCRHPPYFKIFSDLCEKNNNHVFRIRHYRLIIFELIIKKERYKRMSNL
jgi:hypothetical protein